MKRYTAFLLMLLMLMASPLQAKWLSGDKGVPNSQPTNNERFPPLPPAGTFVVDQVGLLTKADKELVNQRAAKLWLDEKIPLLVVTIQSLASKGYNGTIEQYSRELFNFWKLGSQKRNYGIILLVAKDDRLARIEFGESWGNFYNKEAKMVMDDYIVPRFKEHHFNTGIIDGTEALAKLARGLRLPAVKQPAWFWPTLLLGGGLAVGIIISLFNSGRQGWGWGLIVLLGVMLLMILRNIGNDFGGVSDDGSGDGGGASGSW